jgi:hypothetical protein
MSKRGSVPTAMHQQFVAMRNRLVRIARRTLGASASTLVMLCERWGGPASRRAARAFAKSIRRARPAPLRWRLDPILETLTSGASDIDASARRLAAHLRDLVSDQEDLGAMARLLGEPMPWAESCGRSSMSRRVAARPGDTAEAASRSRNEGRAT